MSEKLFDPFEQLLFYRNICFLTGKKLNPEHIQYVSAFPTWLLERYQISNRYILMIEENRIKYKDMVLPASAEVVEAFNELDKKTQEAFEGGFETMNQLPDLVIFQWMARVLYGVLYQEFIHTMGKHAMEEKDFKLSDLMKTKFRYLLYMLQSVLYPTQFKDFSPWSIVRYRSKISKDILNYKDETRKLNFCLGMKDFGIIACLQDNGEVLKYNKHIVEKIGDTVLHPIQFEELYGRFMYANYLLKDNPKYIITEEDNQITYELPADTPKAIFETWDDETYSKVLASLWGPWGIQKEEIYEFPNSPLSYLYNEAKNTLIDPEKIKLPF